MSTQPQEVELSEWTESWSAHSPVSAATDRAAIERRVRRQGFRMTAWTIAEAVIAVVALLSMVTLARISDNRPDTVLAVVFGIMVIGAEGFSLWNRRQLWRPVSESTRAFLELSILRCRRRRLALRAAWLILATEVVVFVPWIFLHGRDRAPSDAGMGGLPTYSLWGYGWLLLLVAVAAAALVIAEQRQRAEARALDELAGALSEDA